MTGKGLPRLEGGRLLVSRAQYERIKAASTEGEGTSGGPMLRVLAEIGLTEAEVWSLAHKSTAMEVVDERPAAPAPQVGRSPFPCRVLP